MPVLNPIEGIEPSEVFQASPSIGRLVVSVYQTYLYVNTLRKDSPFFIYIVDIHCFESCVKA
jgi:hypothetical protein